VELCGLTRPPSKVQDRDRSRAVGDHAIAAGAHHGLIRSAYCTVVRHCCDAPALCAPLVTPRRLAGLAHPAQAGDSTHPRGITNSSAAWPISRARTRQGLDHCLIRAAIWISYRAMGERACGCTAPTRQLPDGDTELTPAPAGP